MPIYPQYVPPSSRLNAKDRAALDEMYGTATAPPVFAPAPATTSGADPFLNVIKRFEGYSAKPYWDYKQYTSGYGTRAAHPGEVIDKATAESRLQDEWYKASQTVDRLNPNLDPGTRAALTSLTFNAGPGWTQQSLGQKIREGDIEGAKPIFLAYNQAGGQPLPALINRRREEVGWFGQNAPAGQPAPSGPVAYGEDSPALGTPRMPQAMPPGTPAAPSPSGAPAGAPGGLLGMLAQRLGITPSPTPGAAAGIPAQAPPMMAQQAAYQPEQPPPLEMPPFQQLQFAGQQPLRLAPTKVRFGRGFY